MSCQTRLSPDPRATNERGAILILTALVMLILLLIAAFATDLGAWYRQGQEQQRAADVGSLNGVQGYDATLKAYVEGKGVDYFSQLTVAQQAEAEQLAMQDAVSAVIGSLIAGGMTINDAPVIITNTPPAVSTATITATDGTVITVTRTADNSITIEVGADGTQYFSNIVRDAPEIKRQGTAVIANCNAVCAQEIPLEPPFAGFEAKGNGDGFRPLVGNNDRVWLVNHLWNKGYNGGTGSIVCMDVREQAICADWAPYDRPLFGAARPADLIDNDRDKLFYPGISKADGGWNYDSNLGWLNIGTFQIGCANTDVRSMCQTTTIGTGGWGGGPWMVGDNVWAISGQGRVCRTNGVSGLASSCPLSVLI